MGPRPDFHIPKRFQLQPTPHPVLTLSQLFVLIRIHLRLINSCPILIHTPFRSLTRRLRPLRFITNIFEQQRNDTMSWDVRNCHAPDSGAVVGVGPQVL